MPGTVGAAYSVSSMSSDVSVPQSVRGERDQRFPTRGVQCRSGMTQNLQLAALMARPALAGVSGGIAFHCRNFRILAKKLFHGAPYRRHGVR